MKGFVYLINDTDKGNAYKIGVTKNIVNERRRELQTGNPSELVIVNFYETDYPYKIESMLHRKYNKSNIKNEWFELTDDEVASFKSECIKCDSIFKSLKDNPFFE